MKRIVALALSVLMILLLCFSLVSCGQTRYAEISVKGYGRIIVKLDHKNAPGTVGNFIALAEDGFYDGLTFHRVIRNFMIQGGDPKGDGSGGSENTIYGEFSKNGHTNKLSHTRGVISMARSEDNNSASSQFFICNADSTHLDGNYAAFGYVVKGMDVVDAITADVFPKTLYADYYGSYEIDEQYDTYKHVVWQYLGNGAVANNADKPVIEYIKIHDKLPD